MKYVDNNYLKAYHNQLNFHANEILADHCEFIAWLFDRRGEHKLAYHPIYYVLSNYLDVKSLMLHEITNVELSIVDFYAIEVTVSIASYVFKVTITIDKTHVVISHNKAHKFSWEEFYTKIVETMYELTTGYQAKKMIRIFVNESALFPVVMNQKSYAAEQGKEKFLANKELISWFERNKIKAASCEEYAIRILEQSGELDSYKNVCSKQIYSKDSVFGTVFKKHSFDTFGYKLQMAQAKNPKVISIGSSRAHFFKESFFKESFYNASYTMTYLQEGKRFLEKLFQANKPSIVIIAVEFWWFHKNHYQETPFLPLHREWEHFDTDYINKLFEYYYEGLLTDSDIKHYFTNKNNTQFFNGIEPTGIRAYKKCEGFCNDGYYWYAGDLADSKLMRNKDDSVCLGMIENNFFHFEKGVNIDKRKMDIFKSIVSLCEEQDMKVVLLLPPVTRKTLQRLRSCCDYDYIDRAIEELNKMQTIEFYDFLDPEMIQSSDDEFYDCYHGGDVTYMRMLLAALENTDSCLHEVCKAKVLELLIQDNAGCVVEKHLQKKLKKKYTNTKGDRL